MADKLTGLWRQSMDRQCNGRQCTSRGQAIHLVEWSASGWPRREYWYTQRDEVTGIPEPTAKTDEANVSEHALSEKEQKASRTFIRHAEASEVQQHQGKLVVVHNKRVVAVGTDRQVLVTEIAGRKL